MPSSKSRAPCSDVPLVRHRARVQAQLERRRRAEHGVGAGAARAAAAVWCLARPRRTPGGSRALETRPASDTIGRREAPERAEPGAALSEAPRCGARPDGTHTDTSTATYFFVSTRETFPVCSLCGSSDCLPIRATIGYLRVSRVTVRRDFFQSLLSGDTKVGRENITATRCSGRAPRASRAPQTRAVRRRVVEPGCLRDRARARTARCSSRACKAASCATPATCAGTCPFLGVRWTCDVCDDLRVERRRSVSERARVDRGDVSLSPDGPRIAADRRLGRARREDVANARSPRVFRFESFRERSKNAFPDFHH